MLSDRRCLYSINQLEITRAKTREDLKVVGSYWKWQILRRRSDRNKDGDNLATDQSIANKIRWSFKSG